VTLVFIGHEDQGVRVPIIHHRTQPQFSIMATAENQNALIARRQYTSPSHLLPLSPLSLQVSNFNLHHFLQKDANFRTVPRSAHGGAPVHPQWESEPSSNANWRIRFQRRQRLSDVPHFPKLFPVSIQLPPSSFQMHSEFWRDESRRHLRVIRWKGFPGYGNAYRRDWIKRNNRGNVTLSLDFLAFGVWETWLPGTELRKHLLSLSLGLLLLMLLILMLLLSSPSQLTSP